MVRSRRIKRKPCASVSKDEIFRFASSLTGTPRERKSAGVKRSENQKQWEDPTRSQPTPQALSSPKASAAPSKGRMGGRARGRQGQGFLHHQIKKRSISRLGSESLRLDEAELPHEARFGEEEIGTRRRLALHFRSVCLAERVWIPQGCLCRAEC